MQIAVATDNLLGIGIPHYELLVGYLHGVEFVDVGTQTRSAATGTESYLAQATYLLHHVRCVVGIDDVKLVATTVGMAKQLVGGKLCLE